MDEHAEAINVIRQMATDALYKVHRYTYEYKNFYPNAPTIIKSLQIADRVNHCSFNYKQENQMHNRSAFDAGYDNGYVDGFNEALAKIRGDIK